MSFVFETDAESADEWVYLTAYATDCDEFIVFTDYESAEKTVYLTDAQSADKWVFESDHSRARGSYSKVSRRGKVLPRTNSYHGGRGYYNG